MRSKKDTDSILKKTVISLLFICVLEVVSPEETTVSSPRAQTEPPNNINEWSEINIDEPMSDVTKFVGERLMLDCSITGKPTPVYSWYKDNHLIDAADRRLVIKPIPWGNRLRINSLELSDAGLYTCTAISPAGSKNTSARVLVKPVSSGVTQPSGGWPINPDPIVDNGDFLPPSSNNAANSDGDEAQTLEPFCQDYKGTYCGFLSSKSLYVTSRNDQINAENQVINLVNRLAKINIRRESECFLKSVQAMCYFKMPLCGPKNPQGKPTVQRLCRTECQELFHVCREDFTDDQTNWKLLPDCWQLNDDPGCLRIGIIPTTTAKSIEVLADDEKTAEDVTNLLLYIILPVVLGLIAIVVILVVVICIRKRKKMNNQPSSPSTSSGKLTNSSAGKGYELASGSEKSASIFVKDVPIDNVHFIQELGAGLFGQVFKGQVFGLYGNGTASFVFVKTLKEKSSAKEQLEFQNEINSMTDMRHQHVLTMLAISTKSAPQCILYEHLPLGNLQQFLLSQEAHGSSLQHKEVMYVLTQIASAVEYLASQKFVHKDIAARNVLVSHNLNVKLSNLKIVYGLNSSDYCLLHDQMIPVRWSPPETITYGQFNMETDVYSFGILMWEVFNGGSQPYAGFNSEEVIEMVRSRQLLACPNNCPPRVYSLMMECWHEKASKRPMSKEVHQKLRAWYLDNSNPYALSTTSAPSVSNSSAPSHHSSTTGPTHQPHITDTREMQSISPQLLPAQPAYNQLHNPPYYNNLYPDYADGTCTSNNTKRESMDDVTSSCSSSSDDDESEFTVPIPNNARLLGNPYSNSSLNRRHKLQSADYGPQTKPFLSSDHV